MIVGGDQPEVTIFDSATKTKRASMWVGTEGPNFGLLDRQGRSRASLYLRDSVNEDRLTFVDEKASPRVGIGLVKNEPSVLIADSSGNIVWHAPTRNAAGATPSETRPRVVIDSWESAGIFLPHHNQQPLDEVPTFIQRCPQVAAALEKREGDYDLRIERHSYDGSSSYEYSIFDGSGGSIGTGSSPALSAVVDAACKGILDDWSSRSR